MIKVTPTDKATTCTLCPHDCTLKEGRLGICGAHRAVDGTMVAESYGKLTALALDPIEKKPLVRFFPGSAILSVGSFGCNLNCPFCQNSHIACARAGDPGLRLESHTPPSTPWKRL